MLNHVQNVLQVIFLMVFFVQSLFFMFGSAEESLLVGYGKAWVKTFRLAGAVLLGGSQGKRGEAVLVWAFLFLCLPGFFLVSHALAGMKIFG